MSVVLSSPCEGQDDLEISLDVGPCANLDATTECEPLDQVGILRQQVAELQRSHQSLRSELSLVRERASCYRSEGSHSSSFDNDDGRRNSISARTDASRADHYIIHSQRCDVYDIDQSQGIGLGDGTISTATYAANWANIKTNRRTGIEDALEPIVRSVPLTTPPHIDESSEFLSEPSESGPGIISIEISTEFLQMEERWRRIQEESENLRSMLRDLDSQQQRIS